MLCYKKDLIEGTENIKFLGKHFLTEDLFFLHSQNSFWNLEARKRNK